MEEANPQGASEGNAVQDTSTDYQIAQRIGNVLKGNQDEAGNGSQEHGDTPQDLNGQEDTRDSEEQNAEPVGRDEGEPRGDESSREDQSLEDQQELSEDSNESEEPADSTEQAEEETFQTLSELQEATGMEDFMEAITAKVKVDGVEQEVTLSEALSGYQRDADYRQKTMQLAEAKKGFESEKLTQLEDLSQRVQDNGQLINILEQEIIGDANDPMLAELRQSDPTEWNARQIELGKRQERLQQYKEFHQQEQMKLSQEAQYNVDQQTQAYLQEQEKLLVSAIPTWSNKEVAQKEIKQMSDYLGNTGYSEQEIQGVVDHRHVLLIQKAMKYDDLLKGKSETKLKKVKKLPKVVKSSGVVDKNQAKGKKYQDAKSRLKKTGSLHDAEAALAQFFKK